MSKRPDCTYCDKPIRRSHKWHWLSDYHNRRAHVNCADPTSYRPSPPAPAKDGMSEREKAIAEIVEYLSQDFSSATAWQFTPPRRKELAKILAAYKEKETP